MKRFIFAVLFIYFHSFIFAAIKLPALVGDNMVLQRNANINIWGWADSGEKVSIQFQGKQFKTTTNPDGKWKLVLPSYQAGGPYKMTIKGKNTITIQNILVGDVWLASGQSNMEFQLKNANNSAEEIKSANFDRIRLFSVAKNYSFQKKQELSSEGWKVCSTTSVENFSAVAFLFGREIYQKYQIPVGLINTSWGGTTAEAWTSAEGLKELPTFKEKVKAISDVDKDGYEKFKAKISSWYKENDNVDRGNMPNATPWSAVGLNTADWSTMNQPGFWSSHKKLKGYSGTIWFRKKIQISADDVSKPLELSFGVILMSDSVYFNGKFIGTSSGFTKKRKYKVPAELVKPGNNLIVVRIKGVPNYGGMVDSPAELYAQLGETKIPLDGEWLYKTGSDISNFPQDIILSSFDPNMPHTPTVLNNAMIAPIVQYTIKGAIWYQGESNADFMDEALEYYTLFPALIKDWRQDWGYDFPFVFVQLAGYQPDKSEPADYPWAHLREAQFKTLSLPNTGMATAIDIGEEGNIHPKDKQDVGHRLALAAERVAYHDSVVYSGPMYKSMKIEGNKIRLSFDNIGSGLWIKDKYSYIRGFAIAGGDKKFIWAKAYQEGNDVVVYSENLNNPVAVRYNWGNTPDGNLYNKENLPTVPFRTDNW